MSANSKTLLTHVCILKDNPVIYNRGTLTGATFQL